MGTIGEAGKGQPLGAEPDALTKEELDDIGDAIEAYVPQEDINDGWVGLLRKIRRLAAFADVSQQRAEQPRFRSQQFTADSELLAANAGGLNDAQLETAKQWAADDRLWTTQETVEFNLRTFARAILAGAEQERTQPPDYKALYHELLFAVEMKYPGESRHQTALRLIQQRQSGDGIARASLRKDAAPAASGSDPEKRDK